MGHDEERAGGEGDVSGGLGAELREHVAGQGLVLDHGDEDVSTHVLLSHVQLGIEGFASENEKDDDGSLLPSLGNELSVNGLHPVNERGGAGERAEVQAKRRCVCWRAGVGGGWVGEGGAAHLSSSLISATPVAVVTR